VAGSEKRAAFSPNQSGMGGIRTTLPRNKKSNWSYTTTGRMRQGRPIKIKGPKDDVLRNRGGLQIVEKRGNVPKNWQGGGGDTSTRTHSYLEWVMTWAENEKFKKLEQEGSLGGGPFTGRFFILGCDFSIGGRLGKTCWWE